MQNFGKKTFFLQIFHFFYKKSLFFRIFAVWLQKTRVFARFLRAARVFAAVRKNVCRLLAVDYAKNTACYRSAGACPPRGFNIRSGEK